MNRAVLGRWAPLLVLAAAVVATSGATDEVRDLARRLPADDAAEAVGIIDRLLDACPESVRTLAAMAAPSSQNRASAEYALHGMAHRAAAPGNEKRRTVFTRALAAELAADHPIEVKRLLIRQIQVTRDPAAVEAMEALRADEALAPTARQALEAIRGEQTHGPQTAEAALAALRGSTGIEQRRAADAALALAGRLVRDRRNGEALAIYEALWSSDQPPHVRGAALEGMAQVAAPSAATAILEAVHSGDGALRAVAIRAAASEPGAAATRRWVERLAKASAADATAVLAVLAGRRDPAAVGAVVERLSYPDAAVRRAAMDAAAAIGGREAAEALVAQLGGADGDEAAACLVRMTSPEATSATARAMTNGAASEAQARMIGVLAARGAGDHLPRIRVAAGDADPRVVLAALAAVGALGGAEDVPLLIGHITSPRHEGDREAAAEALAALAPRARRPVADAVTAAIETSEPEAAAALLAVLPATGERRAIEALRTYTGAAHAEVRRAAVRALAGWPDELAAAPALLETAREARDTAVHTLALRGYLDAAGSKRLDRDPARRVGMCREAMATARRAEEKRLALGVVGSIASREAMELAAQALEDEALREEAAATVVRIVQSGGLDPRDPAVRAVLDQAEAAARVESTRAAARELLEE